MVVRGVQPLKSSKSRRQAARLAGDSHPKPPPGLMRQCLGPILARIRSSCNVLDLYSRYNVVCKREGSVGCQSSQQVSLVLSTKKPGKAKFGAKPLLAHYMGHTKVGHFHHVIFKSRPNLVMDVMEGTWPTPAGREYGEREMHVRSKAIQHNTIS